MVALKWVRPRACSSHSSYKAAACSSGSFQAKVLHGAQSMPQTGRCTNGACLYDSTVLDHPLSAVKWANERTPSALKWSISWRCRGQRERSLLQAQTAIAVSVCSCVPSTEHSSGTCSGTCYKLLIL